MMANVTNGLADLSWVDWSIIGLYSTILYAAIKTIYNLFFHPLRAFPGPKLAAISNANYAYHWSVVGERKIYHSCLELILEDRMSGRYPFHIEELHKTFGEMLDWAFGGR